jgi:hypothetical protein
LFETGITTQRIPLGIWSCPLRYRLDLGAIFYLDRSVPADDQVTSLSALGGNADYGPGGVYYHALERGAGGTRRIASGARGLEF